MGHVRYGRLPYTRPWRKVVATLSAGADAPAVAAMILSAAEQMLARLPRNPGLSESYWLLSQVLVASRSPSFEAQLQRLGIEVPPSGLSPGEFIAKVSRAFSVRMQIHPRVDLFSEMAELALRSTLATALTRTNLALFETETSALQRALRACSTPTRFGELSKEYFADFLHRVFGYFISKEASNHIGPGRRFPTLDDARDFERQLSIYCHETARIVQQFAGGWYSKQNFQGGITPQTTENFVSYAVEKLLSQIAAEERPSSQ